MKKIILSILMAISALGLMAADWISLIVSNTIQMKASGNSVKLDVPLKITDNTIKWADVTLANKDRPFYCKLDSRLDESFIDAMKIRKNEETPSIGVTIDLTVLNTPGTYKTVIVFSAKDKPDVSLTLLLKRPAAILDTVSTIVVDVYGTDIVRGAFKIKETGNTSDVKKLTLNGPSFSGVGTTDSVDLPKSTQLAAGETTTIAYTVSPNYIKQFPIGVSNGRVEINAPEMTTKLIVPFKVINRRSTWWIYIIIFVGLLMGSFVRIILERKKSNEDFNIKANELAKKIAREAFVVKDAAFTGAARQLVKNIQSLVADNNSLYNLRKDQAAVTDEKLKAILESYQKEKEKYDAAMASVQPSAKEIATCFDNRNLNAYLQQQLGPVTIEYQKLKLNLAEGDPANASIHISTINTAIQRLIPEYCLDIKKRIDEIETGSYYPVPVAEQLKPTVVPNLQQIKADLDKLAQANPVGAKEVLAADNIQYALSHMIEQVVKSVEVLHNKILGDKNPGDALKQAFTNSFTNWTIAMRGVVINPSSAPDTAVLKNINEAWIAITALPSTKEVTYGGKKEADVVLAINTSADDKYKDGKPQATGISDKPVTVEGIEFNIEEAKMHWVKIAVLQTLFLFIFICLVAYKTIEPNYMGTNNELIGIFLAAFSLDLTVDKVLQLRELKF